MLQMLISVSTILVTVIVVAVLMVLLLMLLMLIMVRFIQRGHELGGRMRRAQPRRADGSMRRYNYR